MVNALTRRRRIGAGSPRESSEATIADGDLLRQAKRDPAAFAALYDRYIDAVFRYCWRRLGDRASAEDAASQTFARAFAGFAACREDAFRAWLFTIARNVVNDSLRAARHDDSLDVAAELATNEVEPAERAILNDERERVHCLVRSLPGDQREIVELRLAGLTGVEIARALGKSHGAVRVAQHRAFARLRDLLMKEAGGGEDER